MRFLKQSTAFTFRIGPFLDTDGAAVTSLTISQADIQISKAGGAFAQTSASPTTTHDADGWYQCPLTSTDTNTLGSLTVQIDEAGAVPVWEHFMVLPANVYDSLIAGSDNLQVDTVQVTGTAQTARDIGAAVPAAAAGASGGLLISGSNSGTTTLGALTITGALTGTGGIAANITGNLSGSVGSVTASVNVGQLAGQTVTAAAGVTFPTSVASPTNITAGTITTVTNLTNAPTAGDFTSTQKASINTEVLDVLNVDTFAEPAQGAPGATITLAQKIGYLYKAWRNKSTQTSSEYAVYADDASTVDHKATVGDDGTTFTRGEVATGP